VGIEREPQLLLADGVYDLNGAERFGGDPHLLGKEII